MATIGPRELAARFRAELCGQVDQRHQEYKAANDARDPYRNLEWYGRPPGQQAWAGRARYCAFACRPALCIPIDCCCCLR
eukprot:SAG22_NODE_2135_length_2957_cov_2.637859_3_plen_80_part_00